MIDIWNTEWTFYVKQTAKEKDKGLPQVTITIKNVVCKRIPIRFLINEGRTYRSVVAQIKNEVLDSGPYGAKKFTIKYIKKIGHTNE